MITIFGSDEPSFKIYANPGSLVASILIKLKVIPLSIFFANYVLIS